MLKKSQIIDSIESMPDQIEIEDLLERLVLIHKIQIGLEQVERGEVVPHSEVKKELERWRN